MHVELIKRIREKLSINPESKSTLIKKEELLRYASLLYQENNELEQILEPTIPEQLKETEAKLEETNALLVAYETELHQQKQRHQTLKKTVEYFQLFVKETKENIEKHRDRIDEIKAMNIGDKNIKIQFPLMESILKISKNPTKEGDQAMVKLMQEFFDLEKEQKSKSSIDFEE